MVYKRRCRVLAVVGESEGRSASAIERMRPASRIIQGSLESFHTNSVISQIGNDDVSCENNRYDVMTDGSIIASLFLPADADSSNPTRTW